MTAITTAGATTEAGATTSAPQEPARGRRDQAAAAAAWSEQLYAAHHRMVSGLCRALLRDWGEAEDAAQQVFLSAHRALLNGAAPREPAAWLATTARNECWSRIRARMREPLPSTAADDVAGSDDPVADAIRRADLAALWRAIRMLPAQQRDALLLREFGGLRYDELAAALAVTEPAVESLLFRARARLRAQLRAAYAALTGPAWLESLARFGAPALATKAVALGIGAATVTGGAVVGTSIVERHHAPPPYRPAAAVHHRPKRPASTTTTPVVQAAAVVLPARPAAPAAPTRHRHRHDARRRTAEPEQRDGHDEQTVAGEPLPASGEETTTAETTTEQETAERSGEDGGGHDSSGGGSSDGGSSDGGSSGSDGGGGPGPG